MKEYKVIPMVVGTFEFDRSFMVRLTGAGETITMPVAFFCIKGGDKNVLFDTGSPVEIVQKFVPNAKKIQTFEEAIAKEGLKPEDIDVVIQSHMDFDHCGYTKKCKNASVVVQERELEFITTPNPYYDASRDADSLKGLNYKVVTGDVEIADGITVLFTPGHTLGTQSLSVSTAKGRVIITGFCCIEENFDVEKGNPPLGSGVAIDGLAWYASAVKVQRLADIVIPNHSLSLVEKSGIPI